MTVEFDGAYRETMVVFNGFYLGRHSGGYDPFSFDLTDFMIPGQRNVLLVRVDATESDGWFYEGAGIYRHVWLVKTNPVHVRRWGTFVRSKVGQGDATLSIQTEVSNSGKDQEVRVISTILDPAGKPVGKDATATATIPLGGEKIYQQQVVLSGPKLWSLEERNLYKLVTDLQVAGQVVDRYETPFGIRTCGIRHRERIPAEWQAGEAGRARAITRTTPGLARRCRMPCSTSALRSCRRWAVIRCDVAQSADAGAAGCMRPDGNAGV